jgi:serine/threonine-protein kinase
MGEPFQLGRYSLHAELAAGGMATVYLARLNGPVGFGRTVAIKRLHPHLARDPDFVAMFLDEARLAARIQHPNVVPTLDVVATDSELFIVLEYVRGESLGGLVRAARRSNTKIPIPVALAIVVDMLKGLHAAHEAVDEKGQPLHIVHRDVSPQNILVGSDGVARVLDFGVAKAATRLQTTREGQLKGKIPYMAPEQLSGEVTQRTDLYAAGVVLWEALTAKRLFTGETEAQVLNNVLSQAVPAPSTINPEVPAALDAIVLKALQRKPEDRWATARELAEAIDACVRPASSMQVASWLEATAGAALDARRVMVADIESGVSAPDKPAVMKMLADTSGSVPSVSSRASAPPSLPSSPSSAEPFSSSQASVASHIVGSPTPAPASRWKLPLLLGLGGLAIGGLVVFAIRPGRTVEATVHSAQAPQPSATQTVQPSAAVPSATVSATPSASVVATATATATATVRKKPTGTGTKPTSTSTSTDVNSLIDSRK